MKLNPIGANQNEVEINGNRILFSYRTPVAAWIDGRPYRTEKFWSVTTSKHINRWLDHDASTVKPQSFFDNLAA